MFAEAAIKVLRAHYPKESCHKTLGLIGYCNIGHHQVLLGQNEHQCSCLIATV